ncbi:MAG: cell division protein FtsA [Patescibacteria group bacterium]
MKERLLVGLDLGTSKIRIAVGQIVLNSEKKQILNIIGGVESPSQGIAKGGITSLEDTVSSITACLEQAERVVGLPLPEAAVGIGGKFISTQEAKGVIGVSRTDGEIRAEDVGRALEAAKTFVNPANQEIIHILPRGFTVDGQIGIKDPIGMQGIRLEADVEIVEGLSGHIRNLTKAVFRTGLDVTELVYSPLAAALAVTSARDKEVGVCVLNIGAATTGMAVYEDGDLLHAITLPIGADHITSDIAIGLRVSLETAENIKRTYGTAWSEGIPKRGEELDLKEFGEEQGEIVSVRFIAEIIEARVEEIFEKVDAELRKIDREGLLPAGVVLTGGGAKLSGMVEVGKEILRLPCSVGQINLPSSMPEIVQNPAFSTALGLVLWSFEEEKRENSQTVGLSSKFTHQGGSAILSKISSPFRKIIKSFVP